MGDVTYVVECDYAIGESRSERFLCFARPGGDIERIDLAGCSDEFVAALRKAGESHRRLLALATAVRWMPGFGADERVSELTYEALEHVGAKEDGRG